MLPTDPGASPAVGELGDRQAGALHRLDRRRRQRAEAEGQRQREPRGPEGSGERGGAAV